MDRKDKDKKIKNQGEEEFSTDDFHFEGFDDESGASSSGSSRKRNSYNDDLDNTRTDMGTGVVRKKRRNVETNVIALIFVGIFAVMIIYFAHFNARVAPDLTTSPYNPRVTTTAPPNPIRRGSIFAKDGSVLAATYLNADGKEYRSYPKGELFAVPVGMERGGGSGIEGGFYEDLNTATNKVVVDEEASNIDKTEFQGNNVYTTLSTYLQEVAFDALGEEKGAIIAMEPSTGKILAMVSKPTYDPNKGSTDYDEWAQMNGEDSVLLNRATQGLYPPGSTFKIMTALEYLKEEPEEFHDTYFHCEGTVQPAGGARVNCQYPHGDENVDTAFTVSCNVAFSTIGLRLDRNAFRALAENFGFNQDSPLEEVETTKSRFYLDGQSDMSEVQAVSYGQGSTLETPLQNILISATIANGGSMMKPYMVEKVLSPDGDLVKNFVPTVYKENLASEEQCKELARMMYNMVNNGLEDVYGSNPYYVAGKTGTAEYESNSDHAHMWFTCFAPYNNPQIAVVCIMERTEIDYTKATTACKKVIDAYFSD